MKKTMLTAGWGALAAAVLTVLVVAPFGCEELDGLIALEIEPAYVDLTPSSNVVEFVISTNSRGGDLGLPIEWSVTDASLGRIIGSSGYSAYYVRLAPTGINTVIARDQYDNEGYATVRQMVEQYGLTLTATPETVPPGTASTLITVERGDDGTGGTAPFTWTVLYPQFGSIVSGQGSDTAVYISNGQRDTVNVITCTDAYGVSGSVIVEVD
jgi:hypothetical protein